MLLIPAFFLRKKIVNCTLHRKIKLFYFEFQFVNILIRRRVKIPLRVKKVRKITENNDFVDNEMKNSLLNLVCSSQNCASKNFGKFFKLPTTFFHFGKIKFLAQDFGKFCQ